MVIVWQIIRKAYLVLITAQVNTTITITRQQMWTPFGQGAAACRAHRLRRAVILAILLELVAGVVTHAIPDALPITCRLFSLCQSLQGKQNEIINYLSRNRDWKASIQNLSRRNKLWLVNHFYGQVLDGESLFVLISNLSVIKIFGCKPIFFIAIFV